MTMQPGVAGMNPDMASYLLERNQSAFAQDAIALDMLLRRIKGWDFDGSVADVADNLVSVSRHRFALADATRTITVDDDGDFFIHNAAGAGSALFTGTVPYLFRCMYRDEAIYCATDGVTPLRRYAGAPANSISQPTLVRYSAGKAIVTAITGNFGTPASGMFFLARTGNSAAAIDLVWKVLEAPSTTVLTLEDLLYEVGEDVLSFEFARFGTTYPAIPVYQAGTATVAAGGSGATITGTGTKWSSGAWGSVVSAAVNKFESDAFLFFDPSDSFNSHINILSLASDTSMTADTSAFTDQPYAITRRCPFRDAAAHRDSFFGTGVEQFPNTVYAFPQGWNPGLPPGFVPPVNANQKWQGRDRNDFLAFEINVPTPFDGDPNVALLSAPQGLWVLKRKSAHMIYGGYPSFRQQARGNGYGCSDIRSAQSFGGIRVWAGEESVFGDYGEQDPRALTERRQGTGGIDNEWRAIMAGYDEDGGTDYITTGEAHGHMIVHVTSNGGADHVSYLHDLRSGAWTSRLTNHKARFFFSSKVPGEPEKLLWTSDDYQGRVVDSAGAIAGTSSAKNGNGTSPRFQYHSPANLGEIAGIDGEVTLGDVALHANVVDVAGNPAAANMDVTVEHAGANRQGTALEVKTLDDVAANAVDRIRREDRRVNRSGRLVQLKLDVPSIVTDDANGKVEVAEIVCDLFDAAVGT